MTLLKNEEFIVGAALRGRPFFVQEPRIIVTNAFLVSSINYDVQSKNRTVDPA